MELKISTALEWGITKGMILFLFPDQWMLIFIYFKNVFQLQLIFTTSVNVLRLDIHITYQVVPH